MNGPTPGPWHVCETDWRIVEGSDGLVVADVRAPLFGTGREDARLIAAAPDLLEACKRVVALTAAHPLLAAEMDIPLVQAAIAKAEGRDGK